MSLPAPNEERAPCLDWLTANQRYLMAAVGLVQAQLAVRFEHEDRLADARQKLTAAEAELEAPGALETLCRSFGLSDFERDVLVLCAGIELDGAFGETISKLPRASGSGHVTFSLALAGLDGAHWSALTPSAPLRFWSLITAASGESLVCSSLRIDERVLHFLTGTAALDSRFENLLERIPVPARLPESHEILAARLAVTWIDAGGEWPVLQLCGTDPSAHRAIAAAACARLGLKLHALDARDIPVIASERHAWFRLWERESILSDSALLIECGDGASPDTIRAMQGARGAVLASAREAIPLTPRASLRVDVPRPTNIEQRNLWSDALGDAAGGCNGELDRVIAQFDLPAAAIAMTARLACAGGGEDGNPPLWNLCRAQISSRLGELAQRIEARATWDQLILPDAQKTILRTIAAQLRQRTKVYETWGFAARSERGLGLGALFAGPSGTGKTMAAEVLARLLDLDLYRIDLSAVVSKYIGETEKNLRRVFDAAASGGAVLLFDEADALFGRRSEVKDSHDRYANIEVSYLLQRIETYRGLAILTTNLKHAIDAAFVRRLRFIVQFPYPDAGERAQIWEKIFPGATPTEGLDFAKLAQLNVTGGHIHNIAINAAFLAAESGEPVRMPHVFAAAQAETAKLERPLMEKEVAGWI
ncbi:MAG TPA: ATP-binding protein [Chthoniobacterales bacterium]|nr:ATP-binding protein [Chthoniobacterales bacterium]